MYENVIQELRNFMRKNHITQQALGEAIGKQQSYVNTILTGKQPLSASIAKILADAYGFSTDFLLFGKGSLMANDISGGNNIGSVSGGSVTQNQGVCAGACNGNDALVSRLLDELLAERERNKELIKQIEQLTDKEL